MEPKDELFPNSKGVYRQDVEANLEDEKISAVTMDDAYEVYSHYEMQANKQTGDKKEGDSLKRKLTPELTAEDQDFNPNMKHIHGLYVDGQGRKK